MAFHEILNLVVDYASLLFTAVGVFFIAFGGLVVIAKILEKELSRKRMPHEKLHESIRKEFSRRIIFGLEFFIAADILRTVQAPNLDGLIKLAVIVAIRVMLGFMLVKDVGK